MSCKPSAPPSLDVVQPQIWEGLQELPVSMNAVVHEDPAQAKKQAPAAHSVVSETVPAPASPPASTRYSPDLPGRTHSRTGQEHTPANAQQKFAAAGTSPQMAGRSDQKTTSTRQRSSDEADSSFQRAPAVKGPKGSSSNLPTESGKSATHAHADHSIKSASAAVEGDSQSTAGSTQKGTGFQGHTAQPVSKITKPVHEKASQISAPAASAASLKQDHEQAPWALSTGQQASAGQSKTGSASNESHHGQQPSQISVHAPQKAAAASSSTAEPARGLQPVAAALKPEVHSIPTYLSSRCSIGSSLHLLISVLSHCIITLDDLPAQF